MGAQPTLIASDRIAATTPPSTSRWMPIMKGDSGPRRNSTVLKWLLTY